MAELRSSLVFIGLLCVFHTSDCVFCYQCGSSGNEGYCITDIAGLAKSADKVLANMKNNSESVSDGADKIWQENKVTIPHVKHCDDQRPVCMIEEIRQGQSTAVLGYIRDCSNGTDFAYNHLDSLHDLTPNNFTTCAYDKEGFLVCITLCNTNFCNGPKASGASSADLCIIAQALVLLSVGRKYLIDN